MKAYLAQRVVLMIPTLLGISFLGFGVANLAPGDPVWDFLRRTTDRPPTAEDVANARKELGLDRPFLVQYLTWVTRAARGDLGISFSTRRPVALELASRIPATLTLAVPAAMIALVVSIPLGIVSAVYRSRASDQIARIGSLIGASMPSFWLAYLLIILVAVELSLVPVAGRLGPSSLILPVLTLAATPAARLTRFTRSTMLETLGEDYVRTARAKGLRWSRVVLYHALRNALIPVVTAFGTSVGFLVSGAVVIESIFAWPGVGALALEAILRRDYPLIQGFVVYTGTMFVVINLIIDICYVAIDPRVRPGSPRETAAG